MLRIRAVNFFEAHKDGQLCIQAENKAQDEAQDNELLRVQVQDAAAERARAAAEARCDDEPERRVANAAAAAKPGGATFKPEQHAAANEPEQRVAITIIAAEPGSVLVEPEQHVAADEQPPPLVPQPGELSEREVDYTVAG